MYIILLMSKKTPLNSHRGAYTKSINFFDTKFSTSL